MDHHSPSDRTGSRMSVKTFSGRLLKRAADRFLSDRLYFRVMPTFYRLGSKRGRGAQTRFDLHGPRVYAATDPDGTTLFFCERVRIGKYINQSGARGRIASILNKYEFGPVRVEPGDVVIDVGANIGEFSRAVAGCAGQVISVDPDPNVWGVLARNLEGLNNVRILQIALSDTDGEIDFYLSTESADSSIVQPRKFSDVIKVRASTLDSLVKDAALPMVDFLKLEAEGWEPEILAGARQTLKITNKVAVDAGPERHGQPTADAVEKLLTDAGFSVSRRGTMVFGMRAEKAA